MPITYESNEQIVVEIKKLMLENKISQREIAEKMEIKPQGLTKLLNKKNFGFEDAEKILCVMGFDLVIDFKPSSRNSAYTKDLSSRQKELLSELDPLRSAPVMPEPESEPTPVRETLDEKIARLRKEHPGTVERNSNEKKETERLG